MASDSSEEPNRLLSQPDWPVALSAPEEPLDPDAPTAGAESAKVEAIGSGALVAAGAEVAAGAGLGAVLAASVWLAAPGEIERSTGWTSGADELAVV